jgi:hypothetical protein
VFLLAVFRHQWLFAKRVCGVPCVVVGTDTRLLARKIIATMAHFVRMSRAASARREAPAEHARLTSAQRWASAYRATPDALLNLLQRLQLNDD